MTRSLDKLKRLAGGFIFVIMNIIFHSHEEAHPLVTTIAIDLEKVCGIEEGHFVHCAFVRTK